MTISGKDRAAILLAGKTRGQTYWIDPTRARFVTSSYYRKAYPDWVAAFNEHVMPGIWADSVWSEAVPPEDRGLSRPDTSAWEADGVHTAFPHRASIEVRRRTSAAYGNWAYEQPRQDSAVLLLAQKAVDRLRLGQRGPVDFLGISLSATDYVGHRYGPLSREQLDNLYRLDRELGAFLAHLDATVGVGRWVAGREAAAQGGTDADIAVRLARLLEARGLVTRAYTHRELTTGEPQDSFATLFRNSYYPGRAAGPASRRGVEVRFGYRQLLRAEPTGTSHGTPYWYDRWVPFMLLGAGVAAGSSNAPVRTVDLAPSLAHLAGIPIPPDLDGHPVPLRPRSDTPR